MTDQFIDIIEQLDRSNGGISFVDPNKWICRGYVRRLDDSGKWREERCMGSKQNGATLLPRKITLFTLNYDLLSVVLKDWLC